MQIKKFKINEDITLVNTLSTERSLHYTIFCPNDTHMAKSPQTSTRYVSYLVSTRCVNTTLLRGPKKCTPNSYKFLCGHYLVCMTNIFGLMYVSFSHVKNINIRAYISFQLHNKSND
jgi:hypothetical protein